MVLALVGIAEIELESELWIGYLWLVLAGGLTVAALYSKSFALQIVSFSVVLLVALEIQPVAAWMNAIDSTKSWDPDRQYWAGRFRAQSLLWVALFSVAGLPLVIRLVKRRLGTTM